MEVKVGDWVIFSYEIVQVTKVEEGKVREISNGTSTVSGNELTVRPLDLRSKGYAESFQYFYRELNKIQGSRALNWPRIHGYFSDLCVKAIDDEKREFAEGELNQFIKEGQDFVIAVNKKLQSVEPVNGIQILK